MNKIRKPLIIFLLIICIIGIMVYIYKDVYLEYTAIPKLTLNNENVITVELNSEYKDSGAKAILNKTDISDKIKIEGKVDTTKIGEYKITYSVKNRKNSNEIKLERVVKVVDTIKPIITINEGTITIYVGNKYQEPGYTAFDNYDHDITSLVKVNSNLDINKVGEYQIEYSVSDSSNNVNAVSRTVKVIALPIENRVGGLPILMYHFFYDSSIGGTGSDGNWVDIVKFDSQMKYLKDNNYYFPTWDEVKKFVAGEIVLPDKSIVVTVDDGSETFFSLAVPVLVKYNIPATSFIVTSWTNPSNINVDKNLITFMSHSDNMHHGGCSGGHGGIFRCLDYNSAYNDLVKSKSIVGNSLVFAYPFGDYTDSSIQLLKDTGFSLAVTTKGGQVYKNSNPLLLPRVRITNSTSLESFISYIK